jgi:hypothetical protein
LYRGEREKGETRDESRREGERRGEERRGGETRAEEGIREEGRGKERRVEERREEARERMSVCVRERERDLRADEHVAEPDRLPHLHRPPAPRRHPPLVQHEGHL